MTKSIAIFSFVAFALVASSLAHASPDQTLVCDDLSSGNGDGKMAVDVTITGPKATLSFRNPYGFTQSGQIVLVKKEIQPLLRNDLAKLDRVTLADELGTSRIKFSVDGYTFDRRPRLAIQLESDGQILTLSSCLVTKSGSAVLN